jgi:hypothetical protein
VLGDNPIAYWRLGESSGTTAADATGNARNGTYLNGVTLGAQGALAGDSDTSASFDGADDTLPVPDDAALRLNGSWSIEFWARQISYTSLPAVLVKGDYTTKNGYAVGADSSGQLWLGRDNKFAGSGVVALTSSFGYFVVTYDGSTVRWYVNGALTSSTSLNWPANMGTAALELGYGGNNGLDEIALYSTALTAGQIAAHYAAGN